VQNVNTLQALDKDIIEEISFKEELRPSLDLRENAL
jgi:hypothetical protein